MRAIAEVLESDRVNEIRTLKPAVRAILGLTGGLTEEDRDQFMVETATAHAGFCISELRSVLRRAETGDAYSTALAILDDWRAHQPEQYAADTLNRLLERIEQCKN
jgi:hypothetical protein